MIKVTPLFIFMMASVASQDCDSFQCLTKYHQKVVSLSPGPKSLCSATQTYLYCLENSTVICTSLTIHEMLDMAHLLMEHASCDADQTTMDLHTFSATIVTAYLITS